MKLSILIPSLNEKYLKKTIDNVLENMEDDTEIIVGLDGCSYWTSRLLNYQNPRVRVFEVKDNIGQRAITNKLAKMSRAEYVMKIDSHCLFSKGFDKKLLKDMDKTTIMSPYMLCLDEDTWTPRHSPMSSAYCFDTNLVFQYNTRAENKELVNETMCLQGSAWIVAHETYWKWGLDDVTLGSWGHQGVELGIKAFTNGGKCVTNKNCYYAHLFRENEEDFPYKRDKKAIRKTSEEFKKRFKNKDIAELIKKYDYPADWTKEEVDLLSN